MTYNDILAIVILAPIVASAIGLAIIWITFKIDQNTFGDERDS